MSDVSDEMWISHLCADADWRGRIIINAIKEQNYGIANDNLEALDEALRQAREFADKIFLKKG